MADPFLVPAVRDGDAASHPLTQGVLYLDAYLVKFDIGGPVPADERFFRYRRVFLGARS